MLNSFHSLPALQTSSGFKVDSIKDFFSRQGERLSSSLFFRINKLDIVTKTEVAGLDIELFPSIALNDGDLQLSIGTKLANPFEFTLDSFGVFTNGISLSDILKSRLAFEAQGQVRATLPLNVVDDLVILIHDDDIFDDQGALVKVDFSACSVLDLLQEMLGKLGSFQLSPDSVLGGGIAKSLPFDFAKVVDSFDEVFPDVGIFINGVLEAKNELFHLCEEVKITGSAPPRLEDVISLILEDILGESQSIASSSSSQLAEERRLLRIGSSRVDFHHMGRPSVLSSGRRRALRAHHLPYNHFQRPRRKMLQSDLLGDLLDVISIEGGYDGISIFFSVKLDISKQAVDPLEMILQNPLDNIQENELLGNLFQTSGSGSPKNIDIDTSVSASASVSLSGTLGGVPSQRVYLWNSLH